MFKNRYRIVTDNYNGYEAQVKYWFSHYVVTNRCHRLLEYV